MGASIPPHVSEWGSREVMSQLGGSGQVRGSGEKDIEHQMPINILGSASHGLRPTSSIEGTAEEKAGTGRGVYSEAGDPNQVSCSRACSLK